MRFQSVFAVLVLLALIYLKDAPKPSIVKLHGSTSVAYTLIYPNKNEIENKSHCVLEIASNGSGNGLIDLAHGKADIAMISAPLEEIVSKINAESPGMIDTDYMQSMQIGEATVAFIVHASNPVKKLTLAQINNILTGSIRNWKEVGGHDAPIIVFVPRAGDGVRTIIEEKLLARGSSFVDGRRELDNPVLLAEAMSQFPNAIGTISKLTKKPATVAAIETDREISQPLYMVTRGEPSQNMKEFINVVQSSAMTNSGNRIVAKIDTYLDK
ncbi:MAG: substrate-binding domain-containing protein [Verrucomicrobiota bacterium]